MTTRLHSKSIISKHFIIILIIWFTIIKHAWKYNPNLAKKLIMWLLHLLKHSLNDIIANRLILVVNNKKWLSNRKQKLSRVIITFFHFHYSLERLLFFRIVVTNCLSSVAYIDFDTLQKSKQKSSSNPENQSYMPKYYEFQAPK